MKQSNYLDFSNQHIYVGLDVHHKSWTVSIVINGTLAGRFVQEPDPGVLVRHLRKNYPNGIYHSSYEAGFCGFWIHEELRAYGVDSIVVHPADVPTTGKERDRKTDKVDSGKLARSLENNQLTPIYVHDLEHYEERSLLRRREGLVQNQTRCKNRIKGLMKFFGYKLDESKVGQHWSAKYIEELEQLHSQHHHAEETLKSFLEELRYYRKLLCDVSKKIKSLSETEKYRQRVELLVTVPGISTLSAMILLTELGEISRFQRFDDLCSYVGLVPYEHSSGENKENGHLTRRGKSIMKRIIVEASWTAIRKDPGLFMNYNGFCKRMKKNRAIIKIARKLLSRIQHVLKYKEEYKFLASC